ncbi:MAG: sigma-70 family RNA polymerase sigma factor [Niabella sp.]
MASIGIPFSDAQLLQMLSSEKEAFAFESLYQKYHRSIYINVIRSTRNGIEAEDIVQEVFYTLWQSRKKIKSDTVLSGWLFTVSYNKTVDFLRKKIRERKLSQSLQSADDLYLSLDEHSKIELQYELLQNAIEDLSPQRKKVFELCKLQGLTYEQAAKKMGVSKYTIKEYMKDAFQYIRQYVHDHPITSAFFIDSGLLFFTLCRNF